jgi:hypothetical protein
LLRLSDRGGGLDIDDDRVVDIDQMVGRIGEEDLPAMRACPARGRSAGDPVLKVITRNPTIIFALECSVCGFDQRPCKPLAAFGQSCRTMSEIYDYREYPVACEVCNSDT